MNCISNSEILKSGWRTAVILRTCPPKNLGLSQENKDSFNSHIKRCPFCSKNFFEADEYEDWEELSQALETLLEEPEVKKPESGQVWSIKRDLEGWDDEYRYFNTPLILIIEVNEHLHAVKVAQIYSDTILIGPDDVYMDEEIGFAQPWNVYTLNFDDLGYCWYNIDMALVDKVKEISKGEFQEIEANSPLYFFRQLELEVGAFFSLQSIDKIMSKIDNTSSGQDRGEFHSSIHYTWLNDPNKLRQILVRDVPGVNLDIDSNEALEILALMRLPDEEVALAAASDSDLINFNHVFIKKNNLHVQSHLAQITHTSVIENQGWIAGNFVERQDIQQLIVWWRTNDRMSIKAEEVKYDSRYFKALFSKVGTKFFDSGSLVLLGLSYDLET